MQGGAYVFVPAVLIFTGVTIQRCRLTFPKTFAIYCLILLVMQMVASVIVSSDKIIEYSLQDRSGLAQLLRQSAVLLVGVMTMFFVYERCSRHNGQAIIERGVMISAFFVIPVALMQFFASVPIPLTREISTVVGYFFRYTDLSEGGIRVAGFKPEPSLFAVWVAFVFPFLAMAWMGKVQHSRLHKWAAVLMLIIVFLSSSRTGVGIIVAQIALMFLVISLHGQVHERRNMIIYIIFSGLTMITTSVLFSNLPSGASPKFDILNIAQSLLITDEAADVSGAASDHWESNAIRFGAQLANINMGFDNILFGVGFSQSVFLIENYIPSWSSLWEGGRDPFTGTGIHSRIFAEMGIFGVSMWLAFWFSILYNLYRQTRSRAAPSHKYRPVTLLAVGLGLFLGGFAHDSLSYFEYWVYFGVALAQISLKLNSAAFRHIEHKTIAHEFQKSVALSPSLAANI